MQWIRPTHIPVGRVWKRFKGKEKNGLPATMYQIRDIEEPCKNQCLTLMQSTFIRDEPISRALGLASDPESVQSVVEVWEKSIKQKLSVACFTEECGQPKDLVGVNIILVKSKADEEDDFSKVKGHVWRQCLKTLMCAEKLVNVYDFYNVDKYLTTYGLTVLPEHRGQNIGARIMETRAEICKAFDIEAVCIVFTAIASQILAAKCNYQVLATLKYTDMFKHGVDLTRCTHTEAKVMGIKYT